MAPAGSGAAPSPGGGLAAALPVRPELRGRRPYGAPDLTAEVCLNVNENPYPPPPELLADLSAAVSTAAATLNRYPDREHRALRQALASYLAGATGVELSPDAVWAANGSNEVLQQLLQAFGGPGRTALSFPPSYSMHPLLCQATGTTLVDCPRAPDFRIDVTAALAAVARHRPDIVLLTAPNNPTGTPADPALVRELLRASDAMVVVDEAYGEFAREPSALHQLGGQPRLVVVRTLSKAFAFAGARVGYAAATPELVDVLRLVRLPYHLSALTQAAALAALGHSEQVLATVAHLRQERDRVAATLHARGVLTAESDANFLLVAVSDSAAVWSALLAHGVLVRDVGLAGWLRVSVGRPAENDAFLAALAAVTGERG